MWAVYKMDFAELAAARDRQLSDYPPAACLQNVGLVLCANADHRTGKVWMTVGGICQRLRLPGARRSVQRALRALEDLGVIEFTGDVARSGARKYALTIGWEQAPERELEAPKPEPAPELEAEPELELEAGEPLTNEAIIIRSYRAARVKRHDVASLAPTPRSWVVTATAKMVAEIAALTGETFAVVAARAMRAYMALSGFDEKLVNAHHPLDWIPAHLTKIEQQLRKAHKKHEERRAPASEPVPTRASADAYRALTRTVRRRASPNDRARTAEQDRTAAQSAARAALEEWADRPPLKKVGG